MNCIPPETFMNVWSAEEFYLLSRFLAWEKHGENEYQKLISAKAGAK